MAFDQILKAAFGCNAQIKIAAFTSWAKKSLRLKECLLLRWMQRLQSSKNGETTGNRECGTWPAIAVTVAGESTQALCHDKKGDFSNAIDSEGLRT